MAATVTLSTTTLSAPVSASENVMTVASTSGLTPGTRLWVDTELMSVVGRGVNNQVRVLRGVDGTSGSAPASSTLATMSIRFGPAFVFHAISAECAALR